MTETETRRAIDVLKKRYAMFSAADRGEQPICPKCRSGHIVSSCNGRIYKCDNNNCGIYWSIYKADRQ